jgi:hypothetical protein
MYKESEEESAVGSVNPTLLAEAIAGSSARDGLRRLCPR